MPDQYLLGVDIGTYSSKGVLVDAATGNVIAEHAIEHGIEMPKPGWAEHDADAVWWGEFVQISQVADRKERCRSQKPLSLWVSALWEHVCFRRR